MKRTVTIYTWLVVVTLVVLYAAGLATGFSLGSAKADPYQCTGWNGVFFNFSNCGGQQCTGFNIGPFYTSNCTDPYVAPPPAPLP